MVKALFQRLFGRKKERRRDYQDYLEEDHPREGGEMDDANLLIDHRFRYISDDRYERNLEKMAYHISLENTTDYPLGNLRAEFHNGGKLGRFGKVSISQAMVDPGDKAEVDALFEPLYTGGRGSFGFDLIFFDFKYKVEERIHLDTEPLKVMVPRFIPLDMDEDGYRILTSNLYRWTVETDGLKIPPRQLYDSLDSRLDQIGFSGADEMLNEGLFRGIKRYVATDKKGRKWAVQVQVIGEGKMSKLLMYAFGEKKQYAYNLATKVLLKLPERDQVLAGLSPEDMQE